MPAGVASNSLGFRQPRDRPATHASAKLHYNRLDADRGSGIAPAQLGVEEFVAGRVRHRREGLNVELATVKGAVLRLRPVLITASVAAIGLIPLLFATGSGGEIQKPLSAVVIEGLISSTGLTLFILPTLYRMSHRKDQAPMAPVKKPVRNLCRSRRHDAEFKTTDQHNRPFRL